ncbi:T-cell surface glycoprotein CD3 epsilon chain isoform X3 [Calypte anna]|uniref:T-cell surface glycoprotein CD3 epsilon chain isoform X3 n=1 Tax=Calypte anna TaxID=9244 RepID=UPI0011C4ABC9|nr:T-cell surface glycoprotein CD3 epsilon chain isoform X3 [Calypte anna]
MSLELSLPLLGLLLGVEFLVEISGTTVTITCPLTEGSIAWEITGIQPESKERKYVIENHDSSPTNVSCSTDDKKHEMYLNARVCTNCEELDALAVTGIIVADLLITFGVLILVYYCGKNRKGKGSTGSRLQGQKMQRPPPVPNPDYEVWRFCIFSTSLCWLGRDSQS